MCVFQIRQPLIRRIAKKHTDRKAGQGGLAVTVNLVTLFGTQQDLLFQIPDCHSNQPAVHSLGIMKTLRSYHWGPEQIAEAPWSEPHGPG